MIFNPLVPSLKKQLQCENIENEDHIFKLYGIFSAVVYNQISSYLEHCWDFQYASLFEDNLAEDFESVAPYLVELSPDNEYLNDILELYGQGGCIFFYTPLGFDEILQRMREFFNIEDDEGNAGWFLFYNPIVLRRITKENNPEMMQELFAQIMYYYCEAEDDPMTLYRYRYDGSDVTMKIFSLEEKAENEITQS